MTLCLLSQDVRTAINFNNLLDNTIVFKTKSNNNKRQLFLHDRITAKKEFDEFKKCLYDDILDMNGYIQIDTMTAEEKEDAVFDSIKSNPELHTKFLSFYRDCLINNKMNYGRDQKILGATALNIVSILGRDSIVTNLSDLSKQSNNKLRATFSQNYDLISEKPSIALQSINKILAQDKRPQDDQLSDIKNFIQQQFPGANIHVVYPNNLDDVPEEIKNVINEIKNIILNESTDDLIENESDDEIDPNEMDSN